MYSGHVPTPFVVSACGKQWPCRQVPTLEGTHPLDSGFHMKMSPSGQWMRGGLGNQPPRSPRSSDPFQISSLQA